MAKKFFSTKKKAPGPKKAKLSKVKIKKEKAAKPKTVSRPAKKLILKKGKTVKAKPIKEKTKAPVKTQAQPQIQPIQPIVPLEEGKMQAQKMPAKEAQIAPVQQPPPAAPAPAGPIEPVLDLLPDWEDRNRLKRFIFEGSLTFSNIDKSSPDFAQALAMLIKKPVRAIEGYFLVCIKDRSGSVIGAMDGFMLSNNVLFINRSSVKGERKREMHILLHCAALSGRDPAYVSFLAEKRELDEDLAGLFFLLGRGFGMMALPVDLPDHLLFLRRVKKELDPISNGSEISGILSALKPILDKRLDQSIDEFAKKTLVALIPMPTSPDSREHLHELKDAVSMLALRAQKLDSLLEKLREEYVLERKDITPVLI